MTKLSWWEQWLNQPQRMRLHASLFQLHFWIGAVAGAYLTLMSVTGSIIVFRDQLSRWRSVEWLVKLHSNLLAGSAGRWVNGIGAGSLTLLCLTGAVIWWPGMKYWRRSLQVNWRAGYPRINWDLHGAFGFWFFPLVLLWALSGFYFAFPQAFSVLLRARSRRPDYGPVAVLAFRVALWAIYMVSGSALGGAGFGAGRSCIHGYVRLLPQGDL